jgi:Ca-activated chloride channel family protein
MSFQWPLALLSLLAVPAAGAAYVLYRRRIARHAVPFPDIDVLTAAQHRPRLRRYLPLGLAALSLTAFLFALGRPEITRAVPREQATIILAVDVSGSMAADDVAPYRLRAAQDAAKTFADRVPRQYRIGLVSFAGVATLQLPPTTDRVAFNTAVDNLTAQGATAIGEAIFTSLDSIRTTQPAAGDGPLEAARILLLSDGSNTTGRTPEEAAAAAREAKVPVATVALGTPDGVLLNGTAVPPSPGALKALAESTGARSYETRDAESLSAVYERLGSVIGTVDVKDEVTGWPAGIGALLLALAGFAAWRFGSRLP